MIVILFLVSFAAFIFCFIYFFTDKVKIKNKKKSFSFKSLNSKRKKLIISLFIFILSSILLQNIIFALILCIIYLYFDWYIKAQNRRRSLHLIDKQVIEALIVIKSAVQAGKSLQNAINIAQNELKTPIKSEFEKMSNSLILGVSFDKVLEDAARNAKSNEFKLMLDTIRISKDTGASLSGIFERITDSTSQRIAIQSKIIALTAQGRMSGNIVSIIPFIIVFMMYVIEPDMMKSLFITLPGNILLLVVVIMVLVGSFVIRKMTEIDF
ncbi:MAG: type II secretion system F family protein [Endomicrobium sp.]|nr:type II secretion system F family protein [Endomicrobium sp.]